MVRTAVLGFPRIGPDRELKLALEAHWSGTGSLDELERTAAGVRAGHRAAAQAAGIDVVPSGDFSLYDHVLDAALMVGAVPERFAGLEGHERLFAMARGTADAPPLEMTKWFDTNYHYLVPELPEDARFEADPSRLVALFEEAPHTRPVVVGPLTLLLLAKDPATHGTPALTLIDPLADAYGEVLRALAAAGTRAVQIDEPCLVEDLAPIELEALERAWMRMADAAPELELTVATYFGAAHEEALALPAAEVHLDLVRAPEQLEPALRAGKRLSLGLIDGRNVWAADLDAARAQVDRAVAALGADRVTVAPSCSLLHVPYSVAREDGLDPELRSTLAFAQEKLAELAALKAGDARGARRERAADPAVRAAVAGLTAADYERSAPYPARAEAQARALELPELPVTAIGSFPQTPEIRMMRRRFKAGELPREEYERFMEREIADVIARQEELGLDVLVHGEPERNDMVQYFAEQLRGYAISEHGWVQSYGSRCVKPPILHGDVSRPEPMTVRWWRAAQACTERPVKGMLTGPVTMLQWSFVRDDQPREETCRQLALALRDEVADLEAAGARIVQVDEAAFREGLPLRAADQGDYLQWAVDCYRLATAGLRDETQLQGHMCYAQFNDVIEYIARLDADVLLIEASRSGGELLDALRDFSYPNGIGLGVYDIHSPRVPSVEEMERLLERAEEVIPRERLWVNPDCGLKTRRWDEVVPSLTNMVEAARRRRRAAQPVEIG